MELLTFENFLALLTLTSLEIILGIDNLVVLSLLVGKLKVEQRDKARKIGLLLALGLRILLLLSVSWIMMLTKPFLTVLGFDVTGRALILILGGMFLIGKATFELHETTEGEHDDEGLKKRRSASFWKVIVQIALMDIIFSLDSVITAVGMASHIEIMIVAIVIAIGSMMFFAKSVGTFIEEHPTFKVLALSFLVLIGVMLVAEGCGQHVDRGYIYFAMGFSMLVELLNMRGRKKPHAKHA